MSFAKLLDVPEDVIVYLLSFLFVPDILSFRQTCQSLNQITNLPVVWICAWESQIFQAGYPFPETTFDKGSVRKEGANSVHGGAYYRGWLNIADMPREELEQRTRHAFQLAKKWLYNPPIHRNSLYYSADQNPVSAWPSRSIDWTVSPSTSIVDVRFVRSFRRFFCLGAEGSEQRWMESVLVLSVSKGIWSVITIWEISLSLDGKDHNPTRPRKCSEWSPKGGIFTGLCLGNDVPSEADLAVSVAFEDHHEIDLFVISDTGELLPICTIPAVPLQSQVASGSKEDTYDARPRAMRPMKPMTLFGTVLAMSDDTACTVLYDWKTGGLAVLEHEEDQAGIWKQDQIIQVVFAYRSILVVRARSIHLFPEPELRSISASSFVQAPDPHQFATSGVYSPIAKHSFGWVDGVSVVPTLHSREISQPKTLKLLVRLQSDDPWTSNEHSLDLYELLADPAVGLEDDNDAPRPPYLFPPIRTSQVISTRGPLRCTSLVLGKAGTAIWVKPGDRASHGLLPLDSYPNLIDIAQLGVDSILTSSGHVDRKDSESLVAAVFPGPLNPSNKVRTQKICANDLKNWTAFDYDEAVGRVVLGDASGTVHILQL
ncbi:hypothetical protein D9757_003652 [Collybiopsis confluens]|uniref:F-box domain-containing protein n=1 Tax=Collybiopsis confluens TaxID=2823264 RepID=A0A8H5HUJ7_9AGAR|nr:hypothetical protein D9757_003652 [Collybiopsis confluens]